MQILIDLDGDGETCGFSIFFASGGGGGGRWSSDDNTMRETTQAGAARDGYQSHFAGLNQRDLACDLWSFPHLARFTE